MPIPPLSRAPKDHFHGRYQSRQSITPVHRFKGSNARLELQGCGGSGGAWRWWVTSAYALRCASGQQIFSKFARAGYSSVRHGADTAVDLVDPAYWRIGPFSAYILCNHSGHTIHVTIWFSHRVSQAPAITGYLSQPAQMPRLHVLNNVM